jgi:hypothetical protein
MQHTILNFTSQNNKTMEWYNYLAAFFSGAFLSNAVPHFVSGVLGNKFPTPFSKPPGKGLSSPLVNVTWAVFNIAAGFVLLRPGAINKGNIPALMVFFAGFAAMGITSAINFQKKDKE